MGAVRWRGHGPFQRGRRYTAFRQGHARLHRQHGLLKEGCLVSSSRMLSNGVLLLGMLRAMNCHTADSTGRPGMVMQFHGVLLAGLEASDDVHDAPVSCMR